MLPYASAVLQNYYKAIGWNEDNLYSNLTRASAGKNVVYGPHFSVRLQRVGQQFLTSLSLMGFNFTFPNHQIASSTRRIL